MTGTLFLTDTLTAFQSGGGGWQTGPSIYTRKGTLKSAAGEILGAVSEPGGVVACLPPVGTSSQLFRVRAPVGRVVTQNDVSGVLQAALERAGGPGQAVLSAEPTRSFVDGSPLQGSPVGVPAQNLEVEVTVFLSPLPFLSALEKAGAEAGLKIQGVMALEESTAASFHDESGVPAHLFLVDRWHAKAMSFSEDTAGPSALSVVGSGHITADLAVTFKLSDDEAEKQALRIILGRSTADDEEIAHVALARLEELAARLVSAVETIGEKPPQATLVGLPMSPVVERVFAEHGVEVVAPGQGLRRKDPPILALADGTENLASGAASRSAVTALQLDAPSKPKGILDWIRRNF